MQYDFTHRRIADHPTILYHFEIFLLSLLGATSPEVNRFFRGDPI